MINNKKIAILGIGTSAIQALCHLIYYLKNYEITIIHNPKIPIVGIGESTNPTFIKALEKGINYSIYEILEDDQLESTIKLGTQYKKWRKNYFINPLINSGVAIHFNTFKLYDFVIPKIKKIWKNKFKEIFGNLNEIQNHENYANVIVNNREYKFDYIIDCRGFPKSYENYTLTNNPTNHCLVYDKKGDFKHDRNISNFVTGHTATIDGWMFEIPLTTRKSYGYLFNDKITSVDIAKKNLKKELNILDDNFKTREFIFKSYYTNKLIDNRIIKNGNNAVFFEPMFANSLWLYDFINRCIYDYIIDGVEDSKLNCCFIEKTKEVEEMIYFTYHGGSNYNSKFWKITKNYTRDLLYKGSNLKKLFNLSKEDENFTWVFSKNSLIKLNDNFKYNYIK